MGENTDLTEKPENGGDEATEATNEVAESETASDWVQLPTGDVLTVDEASDVRASERTTAVFMAGDQKSGKTTLVAALYERFLRGQFAGFMFAGSRTLVGFEERCALARVSSGRSRPETPRTQHSAGAHFLHLQLATGNTKKTRRNFLIGDISGEYFRQARDSADDCRALPAISSCDVFCLLIDGARLCDAKKRHLCVQDARTLVRRLVEEEKLWYQCLAQIVCTKWDIVIARQAEEETEESFRALETDLRGILEGKVRAVRSFRVAASPKDHTELGVGYGLEDLINDWALTLIPPTRVASSSAGEHVAPVREWERIAFSSNRSRDARR